VSYRPTASSWSAFNLNPLAGANLSRQCLRASIPLAPWTRPLALRELQSQPGLKAVPLWPSSLTATTWLSMRKPLQNSPPAAASAITLGTIIASNGSIEPSTPSVFQPNGDYLFGTELFVGEESRAHNSSTEVLRFTETGVADASFANPAFHYIGTGGSGIEAIVRGVPFSRMGTLW
jgi:hypothetical protein